MPRTPGVILCDYLLEMTEPLNITMRNNKDLAKTIIVINNVLLDIIIVNAIITVINNGKILRYFTAVIWLYCFRFFFTQIFKLPYPEGYTWSYPGMSNFAIKHFTIKGFFFSG
jgi:hypothetical protein